MVSTTIRTDLDRRDLVPPDGLHDFWYPALLDSKVSKKPVRVKMLGEEYFFRDQQGNIAALWDVCPPPGRQPVRRGLSLQGHGWVFDGAGDCVSVLSEGPNSGIPGKVQARHYPTQTLKGMVFVWTGESEPVPSKRMSRRSFSKRAAWSSTAGPNGR